MHIHPALGGAPWSTLLPTREQPIDAAELAGVAAALATRPDLWQALARHDAAERWYERLALTAAIEVWLIGWWPGQYTTLHDHGGAAGALVVVEGTLEEIARDDRRRRRLHCGSVVPLPSTTVHRVGNPGQALATSIHAYSPPGRPLREYAAAGSEPDARMAASR